VITFFNRGREIPSPILHFGKEMPSQNTQDSALRGVSDRN
jgi:hypothetical protein